MVEPFVKMKKLFIGLLGSAILLAGCTAAAPTEVETTSLETEQEPFLPGQSREEIEIQGSSQGEDIGEISVAGSEDDIAVLTPEPSVIPLAEDIDEMEKWIFQSPYASAYYDFLQNCITASTTEEIEPLRFRLVFIDDDDIPELLLFRDNAPGIGVEVYTYAQSQVTQISDFTGEMHYAEREGMMFDTDSSMGHHYLHFYKLMNGTAELICHLRYYFDYFQPENPQEESYEIDGFSVTEDEFHDKYQELYSSHQYVLISYKEGIPIKDADLLPTLAQAIENLLWKRDSEPVLKQVSRQVQTLKAYAKALADMEGDSRFSLIYLDDDDTPELVVIDGTGHIDGARLYVCEQGEAVYVGSYGECGATIYQAGKGIIFHNYEQGGNGIGSVHQVDGTEDILLQEFQFNQLVCEDGLEEVTYKFWIDGREVSEEEYDEAWKKWTEDYRVIDYSMCTSVKCADIETALEQELQTLILTQYDVLRQNIRIKSGACEDDILMMNHDDYDRDGRCEAFVFCGEHYKLNDMTDIHFYDGALWFVGADQCALLQRDLYRMIDGQMTLGQNRKYLYLHYSHYKDNVSDLWTVENGQPVKNECSGRGIINYKYGDESRVGFEIWVESEDHYWDPFDEKREGITYKPYFYFYNWITDQVDADEGESLSIDELEQICGFDLAGEVEAEGYKITDIIRWRYRNIVTVNYTIPPGEKDVFDLYFYENIIWDCNTKDYWKSEERDVTSWRDAGESGSFFR